MIMSVEKTRTFKAGYHIHYGQWSHDGGESWTPMKWATNLNGDYIGSSKTAYYLCVKRGIAPELRTPGSGTCSIGWCEREQKWYGWSHRAMFGFGVGDVVKEGDCHAEFIPVGTVAETLDDAKGFAIAFARSVS